MIFEVRGMMREFLHSLSDSTLQGKAALLSTNHKEYQIICGQFYEFMQEFSDSIHNLFLKKFTLIKLWRKPGTEKFPGVITQKWL